MLDIDYKLAPEYPFPHAINDSFQSYLWALKNSEDQFGIRPQKIILSGDSAGGLLCVAVTILSILNDIPIPHGLLLQYPCLSTDITLFHPSYLHVWKDMLPWI